MVGKLQIFVKLLSLRFFICPNFNCFFPTASIEIKCQHVILTFFLTKLHMDQKFGCTKVVSKIQGNFILLISSEQRIRKINSPFVPLVYLLSHVFLLSSFIFFPLSFVLFCFFVSGHVFSHGIIYLYFFEELPASPSSNDSPSFPSSSELFLNHPCIFPKTNGCAAVCLHFPRDSAVCSCTQQQIQLV